jgi:hypothetical protein
VPTNVTLLPLNVHVLELATRPGPPNCNAVALALIFAPVKEYTSNVLLVAVFAKLLPDIEPMRGI